MIKDQIARVRRVVGLVEEEAAESVAPDKEKAMDTYRQLLAVTMATVFDKFSQEFFPGEDENGMTDEQHRQAVGEFVALIREIGKNPMLFAKSLKVAKRMKSATRVMGKAVNRM